MILKKLLKVGLKNLDACFAGGLFAVTMVIVIINVFTRYLFNYIIPWGEEVATTCFVYTTFIGAAWCLRTHQHVGVDLLVEKLPGGARRVVHLLTDLIILVLNAYITYLSVLYTNSSRIKTMPILKVSSVWLNSALIIGFGLMTIYALFNCLRDVKEFAQSNRKGGDPW